MTFPVTPLNPNNGYLIPQPPDDTISRLRFSPDKSPNAFLFAASWNGSVRVWRVDASTGPAIAVTETVHSHPILDAAWANDGRSIYFASADHTAVRWDPSSPTRDKIAGHDAPISAITEIPTINSLATVGWDRKLKYWDVRAPPTGSPLADVPLAERAYAMDSVGFLMVVALAARRIAVFDVRKPTAAFQEKFSQLRYQSRAVACWPDAMGYCVAGVEGKVSVDHVQQTRDNTDGTFTCHRDKSGGVAINALRFNPSTGALATAASDGHVYIWDKDRRDRARGVKRFERVEAPVCDVDFHYDGSMYAYAVGYDWSQGADGRSNDASYIVLQQIDENDMQVGHRNGFSGSRGRGGRGGRRRGAGVGGGGRR